MFRRQQQNVFLVLHTLWSSFGHFFRQRKLFPRLSFSHIYGGRDGEKNLEFICFDNHHHRLFLAFPFSFAHSCIEDGDFVAIIKKEEITNFVMLQKKKSFFCSMFSTLFYKTAIARWTCIRQTLVCLYRAFLQTHVLQKISSLALAGLDEL